jgi:5-methylcytosine-specific restriction endonuclease McrA
MGHVLVLNASYEPLNITTWRRAMVMLLKGKAEGLRHFVRVPYKPLPLTRRNVFHRDAHTCQYCGFHGESLSIDHIVPRSRGGGDTWDNVTTACLPCNVRKGNRTPREAGMRLAREPRRPISNLSFEAARRMRAGRNLEWAKYVIGA